MYHLQPLRLSAHVVKALSDMTDALDLAPGPGGSKMSNFGLTKAIYQPTLQEHFPKTWHQATVIALYPSSQLVAHKDPPIKGTRHHIPLALNDDCWVFHDGVWQRLEVGQDYVMDPTKLHGAVNWGATRRLHLIIDVG